MNIEKLRKSVMNGDIVWNKHALERMMKRGISRQDVKKTISEGEIIEEYPDDYPLPSCLMFCNCLKALHAVLSYNEQNQMIMSSLLICRT